MSETPDEPPAPSSTAAPPGGAEQRRPLQSRNRGWAIRTAALLAGWNVQPNWISVASILMAAIAYTGFLLVRHGPPALAPWMYLLAVAGIQLRLICNLLDGMVAVEHGKKSKTGGIYNEFPDRIADTLILVGAGAAVVWQPWGLILGISAALTAMLTAYVRVLGVALGTPAYFIGPMAKQHRMALTTFASLIAMGELFAGRAEFALLVALVLVVLGSLVTTWRRLKKIMTDLENRPA